MGWIYTRITGSLTVCCVSDQSCTETSSGRSRRQRCRGRENKPLVTLCLSVTVWCCFSFLLPLLQSPFIHMELQTKGSSQTFSHPACVNITCPLDWYVAVSYSSWFRDLQKSCFSHLTPSLKTPPVIYCLSPGHPLGSQQRLLQPPVCCCVVLCCSTVDMKPTPTPSHRVCAVQIRLQCAQTCSSASFFIVSNSCGRFRLLTSAKTVRTLRIFTSSSLSEHEPWKKKWKWENCVTLKESLLYTSATLQNQSFHLNAGIEILIFMHDV